MVVSHHIADISLFVEQFYVIKKSKTLQVLSVWLCRCVCVYLSVHVYVCVCVLLDNRIISTGQIAALAESSGLRLSANISVLTPAE